LVWTRFSFRLDSLSYFCIVFSYQLLATLVVIDKHKIFVCIRSPLDNCKRKGSSGLIFFLNGVFITCLDSWQQFLSCVVLSPICSCRSLRCLIHFFLKRNGRFIHFNEPNEMYVAGYSIIYAYFLRAAGKIRTLSLYIFYWSRIYV
jgi:hypothetical protein